MSDPHHILFTLTEAKIDLFQITSGSAVREWPFGTPDPAAPIFSGGIAENATIAQSAEIVERRPTGGVPRHRLRSKSYRIAIERVWIVSDIGGSSFQDFNLQDDPFWLRLLWVDPSSYYDTHESSRPWKWSLFGGCLAQDVTRNSDGIYQFNGSQTFIASTMFEKDGSGTVPPVSL